MPNDKDMQLRAGKLYAEALCGLIEKQGRERLGQVREEIDGLLHLLDTEPSFYAFCHSALIETDVRKKVLRKIFEGRISRETLNLLMVLADHGRLMALDEVCFYFQRKLDAKLNRVHVDIETAVPLDDALREEITTRLHGLLEREVILHEKISEDLIAGIRMSSGDRRIDGTARRLLAEMRARVKQAVRSAVVRGSLVESN